MSNYLNREDVIHFCIRQNLVKNGWILIAGEYPNGSDDELHSLKIMDPYFSKDDSPDHRRHSLNKLVPDLIAFKGDEFLIIEMKPKYSKLDEEKLYELLTQRREDLVKCLREFIKRYMSDLKIDVTKSKLIPTLAFASGKYPEKPGYMYLLVNSLDSVEIVRK